MLPIKLGPIKLVLSLENDEESYEEFQEASEPTTCPPLAIASPSSEHRDAYLKDMKRKKQLQMLASSLYHRGSREPYHYRYQDDDDQNIPADLQAQHYSLLNNPIRPI